MLKLYVTKDDVFCIVCVLHMKTSERQCHIELPNAGVFFIHLTRFLYQLFFDI